MIDRWTGHLACLLQAAADMTNEQYAARLGVATRTVAYWHSRPDTVPGSANQEILHVALRRAPDAVRSRFLQMVESPADTRTGQPGIAVSQVVTNAADSISNDPLFSDGLPSRDAVDSLQEEMAVLARAGGMAAFDVFTSARRLRDEARRLSDRTRRPALLADLYAVIGQGTALMASTAFDLGHWGDSATLARASTRYAELAGHESLKTWTYGLRMTLANWRGDPDSALLYFQRAVHSAPQGEPRFRLRYIAARSHALLADPASVAAELAAAEQDHDLADGHPDELSRSVGGEFAFGEARAAACAAAAWLDLRNGEEAGRYARAALAVYEGLPPVRRPYSQISGTRIDIAAAHLHMGDRDGAEEALRDVLDLPPHKRNVSLTGRLAKVGDLLAVPPWHGDPEARRLAEAVAGWLADTSARPLS